MAGKRALKSILRSRVGQFVPSETRFFLGEDWTLDHGDLRFTVVTPPKIGDNTAVEFGDEVKRFFQNTFYKEAPIPKSLGLTDQQDNTR